MRATVMEMYPGAEQQVVRKLHQGCPRSWVFWAWEAVSRVSGRGGGKDKDRCAELGCIERFSHWQL